MGYTRGITRRSAAVTDELWDEFQKLLVTKNQIEKQLRKLQDAEGKSNWRQEESKMQSLLTPYFPDRKGLERSQSLAFYEKLFQERVVGNDAIPRNPQDMEQKMLRLLYKKYQEYPTAEEFMLRIVNSLENPEDGWRGDTLRLRILKQFIKYGDCTGYGGAGGLAAYIEKEFQLKRKSKQNVLAFLKENLQCINDSIFDLLETEKKDATIRKILQAADNLAKGQFASQGGTLRNLYRFAMAYGMTYYPEGENSGSLYQVERDIQANLFRDYYAANFMQYISQEYTDEVSSDPNWTRVMPTGRGINFKNYAEVIYLYHLAKDELSGGEKIKRAENLIKQLKKTPNTVEPLEDPKGEMGVTQLSQELFIQDIMNLSETELQDFLCDFYSWEKDDKGEFATEYGQNSAYRELESILSELEHKTARGMKAHYTYGLWPPTLQKPVGKNWKNPLKNQTEAQESFWKLLAAVDNYLRHLVYHENKAAIRFKFPISDAVNDRQQSPAATQKLAKAADLEDLDKELEAEMKRQKEIYLLDGEREAEEKKCVVQWSPENVSRSALIGIFYYYYNERMYKKTKGLPQNEVPGFKKAFDKFQEEVDHYLEEAGYAAFSGKNIFDVLVAFSSYYYLYLEFPNK